MNTNTNPKDTADASQNAKAEALNLLSRLREDQLEAALAGHIAESAFYATEVRVLREQLQKQCFCLSA